MKTVKNIFGIKETKKSMNSFSTKLDLNAMIMIKGGVGEDDDLWPPKADIGTGTK